MRTFAIAALAALIAACSPPAQTTNANVRALAEGETRVEGRITQIEDGGYPRYTLHIQPDEGDPLSFYLDDSSQPDLGGAESAGAYEGQRAIVYYKTVELFDLHDMRTAAGVSLIHDDGRAPPPAADTITGTLRGAEVSNGDLPDIVTVTDAQGATREFEFFVDDQLAAANGQQVTAHYYASTRDEVTLVHPATATN
jgi:hypothetical protein